MSNKIEQLQAELKNQHYTLDAISEEITKGYVNEDGDYVLPADSVARINVLIGDA